MHGNSVWIGFLVLLILVTLGFGIKATVAVMRYQALSQEIPIKVTSWEMVRGRRDTYHLVARFEYQVGESIHQGSGTYRKTFRNPWTAERDKERLMAKEFTGWGHKRDPKQVVLEREFPKKLVLSAATLIGLLIYFMALGLYVGAQNGYRKTGA